MMNRTNPLNCFSVMNQINGHIPLDPYTIQTQQIDPPHVEFSTYPSICSSPLESSKSSGSLSMVKKPDQHQTSPDTAYPVLPSFGQEFRDPHFSNTERVYHPNIPMLSPYQEMWNPQSAIYSCLYPDGTDSGSTVIDPSVSSTVLEDYCPLKNANLQHPCYYAVVNLCSNQSASLSLADSQTFSVHEYADNLGGGESSSNVEFDDNSILQQSSRQQVPPTFRTYTKIQKAGSVGRSIDVSIFKDYEQLRREIEGMFGLDGLLNNVGSRWTLVYVDFENDVLLVGDDPWEEFGVKCIRILSPSEVQQMGEEGMQRLNSVGLEAANVSTSKVDSLKG